MIDDTCSIVADDALSSPSRPALAGENGALLVSLDSVQAEQRLHRAARVRVPTQVYRDAAANAFVCESESWGILGNTG
jgi:hypothetical protein